MQKQKHIDEMKMIDYLLNQLDDNEKLFISRHVTECSTCNHELEHWRKIILADNEQQPSPQLDEKVQNITRKKFIPLRRKVTSKKQFVLVSSFVATFLFAIGLYSILQENTNEGTKSLTKGYIIAQHDEIPEKQFIQQPETFHHSVVSLTNENVNGDLFLNKETNELIFIANGLIPLETNDYQLWVVHVDDFWNGQLLHLQNGSTRIYYRGEDIRLLKYLKVSVEPQGGSLTPTGPEIFHVDLIEK